MVNIYSTRPNFVIFKKDSLGWQSQAIYGVGWTLSRTPKSQSLTVMSIVAGLIAYTYREKLPAIQFSQQDLKRMNLDNSLI